MESLTRVDVIGLVLYVAMFVVFVVVAWKIVADQQERPRGR